VVEICLQCEYDEVVDVKDFVELIMKKRETAVSFPVFSHKQKQSIPLQDCSFREDPEVEITE
jgi:pantothenate kinase